ncbi:hypothetical protein GCM10010517_43730 [Streptosporangium fragile]|uniref:Uncharacterized protein n=1 Tax=Streptosporangium fragile TaxID=46186 RepID=A0ABN3W232_9ACTN
MAADEVDDEVEDCGDPAVHRLPAETGGAGQGLQPATCRERLTGLGTPRLARGGAFWLPGGFRLYRATTCTFRNIYIGYGEIPLRKV